MSEFERKYSAAMQELEATQMWRSGFMPPIHHLYQKLGFQVRPPHYAGFASNAVGQGLFFAIVWGVVMWMSQWQYSGLPLRGMLLITIIVGAVFGCAMAAGYAYARRKWKLSEWEDL